MNRWYALEKHQNGWLVEVYEKGKIKGEVLCETLQAVLDAIEDVEGEGPVDVDFNEN